MKEGAVKMKRVFTFFETANRHRSIFFILSLIIFWSLHPSSTAIGEVKSPLSIATDRIGSLYNALGSGFAKTISQYSKIMVVVRPFTGPDAWLPALDKGEIELGSLSAAIAWYPYNAVGPPYLTPLTNLRLLRSGKEASLIGFVVAKNSGIKTIKDLKGKRVPVGFGGHIMTLKTLGAMLKTEGLDWADVVQIPVTGIPDALNALGEGRVDVAWGAIGTPTVRELDVKMGVRFLPVKDDPKSLEILRTNIFPGVQLVTVKKGSGPGVLEDIPMQTYDSYLIACANLNDETVTAILNTLWDHTNDLLPMHSAFKSFTREAAVTSLPVIPYHPAAIRFYKEKGVWKEEAGSVLK